jgi:murein DD-endopeptidase MepM/ murein hydrolase activator NlpD
MRYRPLVPACAIVLGLASCASLDQKFADNKLYTETRSVSVKAATTVTSTTSATVVRMKRYLAEKDVLATFHDAGEHSETAVLDVLHKAGVGKHPATSPKSKAGTAPSGSQGSPSQSHGKAVVPESAAALPQQYAGTLRWPVDAGIVSSEYGARWGKMHKGLDIAADAGEPVYAVADGQVIYAGDGLHGYGNVVIVRHDTQLTTLYAHNSSLKVHQGEPVHQGMLIALLGNTGHSTGPHVHFEIREGDAAVNPRTLLPKSQLASVGHEFTPSGTPE